MPPFYCFSFRFWAACLTLFFISISTARVFWSWGNSQRNKNIAIATVISFSGEKGNHKIARYALDTAIIHSIPSHVPNPNKIYDQPLVIIHPSPKHNKSRGFSKNCTAFFSHLCSFLPIISPPFFSHHTRRPRFLSRLNLFFGTK